MSAPAQASSVTSVRCAVLGSPIEHSLSPVLHRAAYAELGLDWRYDAIEVRGEGLADFVDGLDAEWRGLSLTMPLKRTVIGLLDEPDDLVAATGVANTVVFDDGRRCGFNTDIPGAAEAIRERVTGSIDAAVILGGGATAASLGWALADLGCRYLDVFVRDRSTVAETVDVIRRHPAAPRVELSILDGLEVLPPANLIASTIPTQAQERGLIDSIARTGCRAVFDVVYDPWPTPLAAWAQDNGTVVITGLDLLAHQAALQVELMAGRRPSVAVMREAGAQELARRSGSRGQE